VHDAIVGVGCIPNPNQGKNGQCTYSQGQKLCRGYMNAKNAHPNEEWTEVRCFNNNLIAYHGGFYKATQIPFPPNIEGLPEQPINIRTNGQYGACRACK
jgi:hypothetical protein